MGENDGTEIRLRFPTLELYSALHGGALSLGGRPLSASEWEDALFIFESSINYDKVRIVSAVVANAPTTLGNTIRIGMDGKITRKTLIHELGHIWQYQTKGTSYISNSLCAQVSATISAGTRNAAYEISEDELKRTTSIHQLSAEKQAVIIETFYADPSVRSNAKYQKFIGEVRAARPLPEAIIQEEAAFGPGLGRNIFDSPTYTGQDVAGTVPIIRLEFDLF